MVQKRKINKSTSAKSKSTSASSGKSKLGETSLDWITDTTEGETLSPGLAEDRQSESAGVSKETKIGVVKQYSSEETVIKTDDTPEVTPVLSNSSTITKGKRVTSAEEEEEKTITAEESPIEIGKTYKITEEKKVVLADKEEKTVSGEKKIMPDEKKISPEYEVKKEEVIPEEKIVSEGPSVLIPEDSIAIVKKKTVGASREKKIRGEGKIPSEEKKTAVAAKEEVPPSASRKWMRMSSIAGTMKKGGKKVSGVVVKPFKSGKTQFKKSVSSLINVSKQPVKSISAIDRKITKSMKKVVMLGDPGNADNGVLSNIKSADSKITKSAKKLIDSILG